MQKALSDASTFISVELVPLKKKSLLRYLPLILELLELLIAPFKLFPVIMKRRGTKTKQNKTTPEVI